MYHLEDIILLDPIALFCQFIPAPKRGGFLGNNNLKLISLIRYFSSMSHFQTGLITIFFPFSLSPSSWLFVKIKILLQLNSLEAFNKDLISLSFVIKLERS